MSSSGGRQPQPGRQPSDQTPADQTPADQLQPGRGAGEQTAWLKQTVRLKTGAAVGMVAGGLGLAAVACSFLPYYRLSASLLGYSDTHSTTAWDSWASTVGVALLAAGSVAVATSGLLDGRLRAVSLVGGTAASSLALPFLLVSMLYWPDYSAWKDAVSGTGVAMSQARGAGCWLVLLLAVVVMGLCWTCLRMSRPTRKKAGSDSPPASSP